VLVCELCVADGAGRPLVADLIACDLQLAGGPDGPRWSSLRSAADRVISARPVQAVLERALRDTAAGIAAHHQHAIDALARRERAISAPARSAARELVQAGLFDRRSIRAARRRHEATAALLDRASTAIETLSTARELTVDARPRAILFLASPPWK
jgi:hypothetical protein